MCVLIRRTNDARGSKNLGFLMLSFPPLSRSLIVFCSVEIGSGRAELFLYSLPRVVFVVPVLWMAADHEIAMTRL